jgi:hypothetical protein
MGGEGEQQQRGQLSPKNNEDIPKEPVSLSFNKTAFSLKHEECIREALARSKFQYFYYPYNINFLFVLNRFTRITAGC